VICQWVNTYDISSADLQSVVATFAGVFPHATLWLAGDGDLLLVGSTEAMEPKLEQLVHPWSPGVQADLQTVAVTSPFGVLSMFMGSDAAAIEFGSGADVQTDNRMALEFSAPRALHTAARRDNVVRLRALADPARRPPVVARAWVEAGGDKLKIWQLVLAAADPSDPRTETALSEGVEIAAIGGLPAPFLHRLLAVLDALDYEVPIPLWDEASKMPQPNDGYLPETGVLSQLKDTSDHGDVGRTVLLVAAALGPKGPADANLLALGDAVRALKRVGLDAEARRVGFEALYAHMPQKKKA